MQVGALVALLLRGSQPLGEGVEKLKLHGIRVMYGLSVSNKSSKVWGGRER